MNTHLPEWVTSSLVGVAVATCIFGIALLIEKVAENLNTVAPKPSKTPKPPMCLSGACDCFRSPDCADGRCRYHCKVYCGCEKKPPPGPGTRPNLSVVDKELN